MESKVAELLGCRFKPIVIVKSDEKPLEAIGPKDKSHCVMSFIANVIANRKTAVFDRSTTYCTGAVSAFGFGNGYTEDEVTLKCFSAFLSTGLKEAEDKEVYELFCKHTPDDVKPMFEEGERIFSSNKQAKEFLTSKVPTFNNKEKYVIFKPIEEASKDDKIESVIFTVNTFELASLVNFDTSLRDDFSYLLTPPASACQAMASYVFMQAESDDPHPVLGLLDFAGRNFMSRWIPDDYLNVSVPFNLFEKYEENCEYSYLDSYLWNLAKK